MLAPSGDLLRAGIGLKLNQVKTATRSYLRDRTHQATGTMTSYMVAAGLFGAAGVFLIAACLVGTIALYRWIAIHYGQFWGFGAIGGLLLLLAAVCAGAAAARLKRPPPHFPSLTSRLRVAIKSHPLKSNQSEVPTDTVAPVEFTPSTPPGGLRASEPALNNRAVQAGLIVAATLIGWAVTRRRAQLRQAAADVSHQA